MSPTHVLFEFASGYAIFEKIQVDEIALDSNQMQDSFLDLEKFSRILKLVAFFPFKDAAHALENINDVSEGILNDYLKECLEINISSQNTSSKKQRSIVLGVLDKNLSVSIKQSLGIECESGSEVVAELIRAIRFHSYKLFSQFKKGDFEKAQLGLGHSYSRAKVKFNVNRSDNMIIQSICLLDQMDKDINTFAMRAREWYSWHFPELAKLIPDNYLYAKLIVAIQNKQSLTEKSLSTLEAVLDEGNRDKAPLIIESAKSSMGTDISELDMLNITNFAKRVVSLTQYRNQLSSYLSSKMSIVAPNLATLIGDVVGARLISRAGSLTNLSKAPASTVQILGAEKALFRALKTKGNTPKYGIIYHSSFIGKAGVKNKGRISRYLANKCSIASRIDCFSDIPCSLFGQALKKQVDERLQFYDDGHSPRTNIEVMHEANVAASALATKRTVEEEENTSGSTAKKMKKESLPSEVTATDKSKKKVSEDSSKKTEKAVKEIKEKTEEKKVEKTEKEDKKEKKKKEEEKEDKKEKKEKKKKEEEKEDKKEKKKKEEEKVEKKEEKTEKKKEEKVEKKEDKKVDKKTDKKVEKKEDKRTEIKEEKADKKKSEKSSKDKSSSNDKSSSKEKSSDKKEKSKK